MATSTIKNITPANIGAPTTTGSGASGIWNINIPFSGEGTTGFKSFTLNAINIDDTPGDWVAGFSDRTNRGTFPSWNIWWTIVRQYESAGFLYQFANQLDNNGTTAYMSVRAKWTGSDSWGPWIDTMYDNAVPVTCGGTGATVPGLTPLSNLGLKITELILNFSNGAAAYNFDRDVFVVGCCGVGTTDVIAVSRTNGYKGFLFINTTNTASAGNINIDVCYIER